MTPKHHALLLGFFMEEILDRLGPEGAALISTAVCRYGEGRGRRMAERAARDGRPNDLLGFLLWGELNWADTGNRFKMRSRKPFFKLEAQRCFWHETWAEQNMARVGRFYCRDIDRAILAGFNPDAEFRMPSNMGDGAECCEFHYPDWQLSLRDLATYVLRGKKIKKRAVRSWTFHCRDVFQVFSGVIREDAAAEAAAVIERTLHRFSGEFGEPAARMLA